MSGTMIQLTFGATVIGYDGAPDDLVKLAGESGSGVDDYVQAALGEAMHAAGEAFVAAHPEWFRVQTLA